MREWQIVIVYFLKTATKKKKKKKTDGKQYDQMLKVLILDDRNKGVCCFILCVFLYFKQLEV